MDDKIKNCWAEFHSSKKVEYRDELIIHYLHLVKYVVGRVASGLPKHIKMDDLYSSGVTGLVRSIEKYDPTRKAKFESYAILLIKGAIIDELRELDWIPRSVHQRANQISDAQGKLQQHLGRDPSDDELCHHLGMNYEEFSDLLVRIRPAILIPLNASPSNDDEEGIEFHEKIADQKAESGLQIAERNEFSDLLRSAIHELPDQERKVLTLYYFEDLMLKEIGKKMGVSESRISQIHTKALLKLRGKLKSFKT